MKKLSNIFGFLAILLTNVMVAVIAYNYGVMKVGVEYGGYSAPLSTVFLYAIPFGIGIIACIAVSIHYKKMEK